MSNSINSFPRTNSELSSKNSKSSSSSSSPPISSVVCNQQGTVTYSTQIEHLGALNINCKAHDIRKTGIICTLGPSSRSVEVIQKLIESGMTIARLNFSHGSYEYHEGIIKAVREAVNKYPERRVIAIALDTKGPEIRTGVLEAGVNTELELKTGDQICVTTTKNHKEKCNKSFLYVDYKNMPKVVAIGTKVFVDDGLICLVVEKIENDNIFCKIVNGGRLGSKKGVNLPGTNVDLPAVSEKDIQDLKFGVSKNVDMIFASFIRNADGIKTMRKVLGAQGKDIKIIAKVENQQGIDNIDEIVQEADGVMIARGDLGIEIPPEKVFVAQKMMIAKCNRAGKPIICATQMLESMTRKPRPTRAEGTDVANAVLDGADCVMLSGETAKGDYPVETVRMMHDICREAEAAVYHVKFFEEIQRLTALPTDISLTMAATCVSAAVMCRASAILVLTLTGKTTQLISKYRPFCPIICVTTDEGVARRLLLYRAVMPVLYKDVRHLDWPYDVDDRIKFGLSVVKERNIVKANDKVVIVTGWRQKAGFTNSMRIVVASKEYGFS